MTPRIPLSRQISSVDTMRSIVATKSAKTLGLSESQFEYLRPGLEAALFTLSLVDQNAAEFRALIAAKRGKEGE